LPLAKRRVRRVDWAVGPGPVPTGRQGVADGNDRTGRELDRIADGLDGAVQTEIERSPESCPRAFSSEVDVAARAHHRKHRIRARTGKADAVARRVAVSRRVRVRVEVPVQAGRVVGVAEGGILRREGGTE